MTNTFCYDHILVESLDGPLECSSQTISFEPTLLVTVNTIRLVKIALLCKSWLCREHSKVNRIALMMSY